MPDLKQENEYVNKTLLSWIKDTINDYDFDGVRYADVSNVPKWFWKSFTESANTYTFGVVSSDNASYIADYQNYMDGVGDYPLYYVIRDSFCDGSMKKLEEYHSNSHKLYKNPEYNAIWIGNHDNNRFLNVTSDEKQFKNAIIFSLFYEGIPIFYYGDEQKFTGGRDPLNRETLFGYHDTTSEIYQMVKSANQVRKDEKVYEQNLEVKYADDNTFAFIRGNVLIVVGNNKKQENITVTNDEYNENALLCNKLQSNDCITVDSFKELKIQYEGEPKIYVVEKDSRRYNSSESIYSYIFLLVLILLI